MVLPARNGYGSDRQGPDGWSLDDGNTDGVGLFQHLDIGRQDKVAEGHPSAALLEMGDVSLDHIGNVQRTATQTNGPLVNLQFTTQINTFGLAHILDRHSEGDDLPQIDLLKIDMQQAAGNRFLLDLRMSTCRCGLLSPSTCRVTTALRP